MQNVKIEIPQEVKEDTRKMIDKLFLDHPRSAGETYGQHLLFTLKTGATLIYAGVCLIIHGLFPILHETTASNTVFKLNDMFVVRRKKVDDLRGE